MNIDVSGTFFFHCSFKSYILLYKMCVNQLTMTTQPIIWRKPNLCDYITNNYTTIIIIKTLPAGLSASLIKYYNHNQCVLFHRLGIHLKNCTFYQNFSFDEIKCQIAPTNQTICLVNESFVFCYQYV